MSGPRCFENPPDLSSSSGAGAGTVHELVGLEADVAGPLDYKLAVILVADVYHDSGYEEFDEFAVKSAEESHQDTLNWFLKHCFENPPQLSSPAGAGHVEEVGGLKTYVTGPPDSNIAVLVIADAFGFEAPKLRKFADRVACAGFLVVVPDFFYGDAVDPDNLDKLDRDWWMKSHSLDRGSGDAVGVITALKSKGVSATGAVGFCWGGMVLAKLAGLDKLQAAVILHPGEISKDEIKAIKIPTIILGAEHDHVFPSAELKKFEELLAAKSEVECYVKIFPGVAHGWSTRYKDNDELAIKSAEEAQQDTLNWLVKYVKSR